MNTDTPRTADTASSEMCRMIDRIAQLERELAEARERLAMATKQIDECVGAMRINSQTYQTQRASLEKAREALECCRLVVQNEINVKEMLGKLTNVWPDLLTGCVSGGGIHEALAAINAALEEKE